MNKIVKYILRSLTIVFAAVIIFLSIITLAKTSQINKLDAQIADANGENVGRYTVMDTFEMADEKETLKEDIQALAATFAIINISFCVLAIGTIVVEFVLKDSTKEDSNLKKYR